MASRSVVNKRRKQLCGLVYRGVLPSKASEKLAEKYGVTPKTILNDWYSREEWLPDLFELEDPKKVMLDLLSEQKEFKRELWKLANETENDNIKLGVFKQLQETNKRFLEMLQDLGVVDKTAMKLEISGKGGGVIEIEGKSPREKLISEINSISSRKAED